MQQSNVAAWEEQREEHPIVGVLGVGIRVARIARCPGAKCPTV